jgi:hypothetical protein
VHARLARWCESAQGEYAWVFDNATDGVVPRLTAHPVIGFDVTEFLNHELTRSPVTLYLFHLVRQLLDGRRLVCWMDEFWRLLADAAFENFAKDRTLAAQGIDREPRPHLPRAAYEMERRGEVNALAERMRAEHEARVQQRVEAAAAKIAPQLPRNVALAQSMEDIRRQARENWLQLRQSQRVAAPAALGTKAQERGIDDDLAR